MHRFSEVVSRHSTCHVSSLPETVSARKLAEIHVAGYGEVLVDVTWTDLENSCILIIRKKSCSHISDPEDTVIQQKNSDESSCGRVLTPSTLVRTFSLLSLTSVIVLLSGSSGTNLFEKLSIIETVVYTICSSSSSISVGSIPKCISIFLQFNISL